MNKLKQKYLLGKEAELGILLKDAPEQVHSIKFDAIDAVLVKRTAVRIRGGAGPFTIDADWWRRILITKQFGTSFTDLCKAILKSSRNCAQQIIFQHH